MNLEDLTLDFSEQNCRGCADRTRQAGSVRPSPPWLTPSEQVRRPARSRPALNGVVTRGRQ
jgi:hypothetical protein